MGRGAHQRHKLASYCLTEPGAGSDAASLKTRAELVGNEYIINGSKAFISGAGSTDVLVLMARPAMPARRLGHLAFAVPADADGVSYGKKEEKWAGTASPRASSASTMCAFPPQPAGPRGRRLQDRHEGPGRRAHQYRHLLGGRAQGALTQAQQYMQERKQFGKPIASFQALQFKLADMATELVAARQMVRLAASKLDAGARDASTYCAMAKRFATDAGFMVCNEALQLHGGYGYIREYPLERLMRDARVHQILEGTNEIMRVIIARRMLDGDAWRPSAEAALQPSVAPAHCHTVEAVPAMPARPCPTIRCN
jgi:alkylation response protein AidB-like acyl-CoA dehydrogenase